MGERSHKDIKGNEKADKLSKETSILGHESEGVVTPAGLKAWARRVRAEARGGSGEGILGWHRKAISAYTWSVTEKGPQNKWLHYIKKGDTPECRCQQAQPTQEQSGEHLVERCSLITRARNQVGEKELLEWKSRHARNRVQIPEKKKKGPVEPEKENEKETDKLELFFRHLYEFHNPVPDTPAFVPADSPPRYAIDFVPAAPVTVTPVFPSPISSVISPVVPTDVTDYSVISSVNFVAPVSSTCIESTT